MNYEDLLYGFLLIFPCIVNIENRKYLIKIKSETLSFALHCEAFDLSLFYL